MPRNYNNEYEWSKNKYDIIRVRIPKELGDNLRLKLKNDNLLISEWAKLQIERYLDSN